MDILKQSDGYKETADTFLSDTNFVPTLRKYGDVEFEGAYAGNVMLHGDVDIVVVGDRDFAISVMFLIAQDIDSACPNDFRSYYIKSDWDDPRKGKQYPYGHYLGFRTQLNDEKWKFDVWFVGREERERNRGVLDISKMVVTQAQRQTILEFKNFRKLNNLAVSGQQIYEAVLLRGVTNPEELVC